MNHGPWIDVHAHPGRCFLGGLPKAMPLTQQLGAPKPDACFEAASRGEVAVINASTVADLRVIAPGPGGGLSAVRDFRPDEATADHDRQLGALESLVSDGQRTLVLTPADVAVAADQHSPGVFFSCEGGDFLDGDLGGVEDCYNRGVRSVTLVHYRVNELGDIQTETPQYGGLSLFGREVVREMNRVGIIVDLAHATMEATADALEESTAPIMISHSHLSRPGASHPRLLSAEHARLVADAGGIVGAWPSGVVLTSLDQYCEEICRMIEVLGIDHVSIGTDMDANYKPVLTTYEQFPELAAGLIRLGLHPGEVDKVLGGNFLRLFEAVSSN